MSSSSSSAADISGVIPIRRSPFLRAAFTSAAGGQQKLDKVCPTNRLKERRRIGLYISNIGIGVLREKGLNNGG